MMSDAAPNRRPPGLAYGPAHDRVEVLHPARFTAGAWEEIVVAITIDGPDVGAGDGLALGVPYGFPQPQTNRPDAPHYTTVQGPDHAVLAVRPDEKYEHFIRIAVQSGRLAAGDRVTVRFGDRSGGSPGMRVPLKCHRDVPLPYFRVGAGPGLSTASPFITIEPGPRGAIRAFLPAVAKPGEPASLRIAATDGYGNPVAEAGPLEVVNAPPGATLPDSLDLTAGRADAPFPAPAEGVCRIVVRDPRTATDAVSNPLLVSTAAPAEHLYFGDIHVHTEISTDAGGIIEDMYTYARDVSCLDFAAATDHETCLDGLQGYATHWGALPASDLGAMRERWARTVSAAARFNEPGRFVTFVGTEASHTECAGHRNVYFLDDDPPMQALDVRPGESNNEAVRRCRPLHRLAERGRVIAIPHHPPIKWGPGVEDGGGLVFDDLPANVQPVVEIYSKHGTSEYLNNERPLRGQRVGSFADDFLRAGHRFGFIGGSDTHLSDPGSRLREGPYATLRFRGGLAAVRAPELTRDALWEALLKRRCYATTGPRIVLLFTVNDLVMGEEGAGPAQRHIRVEAHGEAPITVVEIVGNGRVLAAASPHRPPFDIILEHDAAAEQDVDYYYARIRQHDGERAWSSPIWVRRG